MSNLKIIVNEGLKLSEQLLDIAKAGDWETFLELDKKRQTLIRSLKVVDIQLSDADFFRENFQKIKDLNDELEQICLAHRDEAAEQLKSLQKSKKVENIYRNI